MVGKIYSMQSKNNNQISAALYNKLTTKSQKILEASKDRNLYYTEQFYLIQDISKNTNEGQLFPVLKCLLNSDESEFSDIEAEEDTKSNSISNSMQTQNDQQSTENYLPDDDSESETISKGLRPNTILNRNRKWSSDSYSEVSLSSSSDDECDYLIHDPKPSKQLKKTIPSNSNENQEPVIQEPPKFPPILPPLPMPILKSVTILYSNANSIQKEEEEQLKQIPINIFSKNSQSNLFIFNTANNSIQLTNRGHRFIRDNRNTFNYTTINPIPPSLRDKYPQYQQMAGKKSQLTKLSFYSQH